MARNTPANPLPNGSPGMAPVISVHVIWIDGTIETFSCNQAVAKDGVLYLFIGHYPATDEPNRAIPLVNVRLWTTPS